MGFVSRVPSISGHWWEFARGVGHPRHGVMMSLNDYETFWGELAGQHSRWLATASPLLSESGSTLFTLLSLTNLQVFTDVHM